MPLRRRQLVEVYQSASRMWRHHIIIRKPMKPKLIILLAVLALLPSCASRTAPEFLQNAAASLWGGGFTAADGSHRLMAAPAPQPNGFDTFYHGTGTATGGAQ